MVCAAWMRASASALLPPLAPSCVFRSTLPTNRAFKALACFVALPYDIFANTRPRHAVLRVPVRPVQGVLEAGSPSPPTCICSELLLHFCNHLAPWCRPEQVRACMHGRWHRRVAAQGRHTSPQARNQGQGHAGQYEGHPCCLWGLRQMGLPPIEN